MSALLRRVGRPWAIAAAVAFLATGCGNTGKVEGSAAEPPVMPEIDRAQSAAAAGQPGEVVIKYWDYLRAAAFPLAANAFDPEVERAVGEANLLGAMQIARGAAQTYAPRLIRVKRLPFERARDEGRSQLTLIDVENRGVQGAKTRESFLVARAGSRWVIVYDTVTESALRSFVATYRQNDPNASARLSEAVAIQAAGDAAREFQGQARRIARGYF